ncbi:SDR family oxidoreductase [bacterium]|nr:MAG: SDR family oxidoreductase [bacterium]
MSRRVLVTGSARGIGRAIALRLAEAGWQVAIHGRSASPALEATAAELESSLAGVYAQELEERPEALWSAALADGEIHALVNNAGVYQPFPFLTPDDAAFKANVEAQLTTNFMAPLMLTRAAALHFAGRGGGKILNVASRVGFRGEPNASLYAASKAALINLTRSLAVELAPNNIGVFGIAPGWVDTAMVRDGMQERLTEILKTLPLGRMASPEDCAAATAFLLSDEAAYLSGVTIDINGASYFH